MISNVGITGTALSGRYWAASAAARAMPPGRSCSPSTPRPLMFGCPYNATSRRPGNSTRPPPGRSVPESDTGSTDGDPARTAVPDTDAGTPPDSGVHAAFCSSDPAVPAGTAVVGKGTVTGGPPA